MLWWAARLIPQRTRHGVFEGLAWATNFDLTEKNASGDQCELSESSSHLIQTKFNLMAKKRKFSPFFCWFPPFRRTFPPLFCPITLARGKCPFNPVFLTQWNLVYRQGLASTRLAETPNNKKNVGTGNGTLRRHLAAAPATKLHSTNSTLTAAPWSNTNTPQRHQQPGSKAQTALWQQHLAATPAAPCRCT